MKETLSLIISMLKGIWKYRWHGTAVAWLVAAIGGSIVYLLPNQYQASARVYVDTQNILKPLLQTMTSMPNMEQQVAIMSRTLLSRPNIEKVIRMADVDINSGSGIAHEKLTDDLMKGIQLTAAPRADIYTITYKNENPGVAKDVVQSLLTIFVENGYGDKKQDSSKAVNFIDEQIKVYEEKLTVAENNLKEFKLKNAEILPGQESVYGSKVRETTEQLNEARLELTEAEQARDAIKKQIAGEEPAYLEAPAAATAEASANDLRLRALSERLDELQQQYTERHPDVVATKRLMAQLEERKQEEAKSRPQSPAPAKNYSPMLQQMNIALSEAEAIVAAKRARVAEFAARNRKARTMSAAVSEVEAKLAQLNRDYAINKENYEKLIGRREAAKLSGEMTATSDLIKFRIIDPPVVPLNPVGPNRPRLLGIVIVAALAAGAALAFLLSQFRPTFQNPYSLKEATGLPVLGTVSMNWTPKELARKRRGVFGFGLAFSVFVAVSGAAMAAMLLRH